MNNKNIEKNFRDFDKKKEHVIIEELKEAVVDEDLDLVDNILYYMYEYFDENSLYKTNKHIINKELVRVATNENKLDSVIYLLNNCTISDYELQSAMLIACKNNSIDMLNLFLHSTDIPKNVCIHSASYSHLKTASSSGSLDIIKYLFEQENIGENVDIQVGLVAALSEATKNNQQEVFNYLVYDRNLKKNADMYHNNGNIFLDACQEGSLEMVDFLLKIPEFKDFIVKENTYRYGIEVAAKFNHINVLKYLIEEQEYPVTEVLVNYVKGENYSNQYYEVAAKYIDSYLLQKKLANEMTQENKTNKPKKI